MILALHGETLTNCNLLTHIRVTQETGYDMIELSRLQLFRYLERGFTVESLLPLLEDIPPIAMGYIKDIERQEPHEYKALMDETEYVCGLAQQLHCPNVQLLTGPLGPGHLKFDGYMGLTGRPWKEVRDLTAKNLKAIAAVGASHGITFYLEPIAWTPIHTLAQGIEVIDATGADNVGMVMDFWHMWCNNDKPEDIARLDKRYINGVHFCDSLPVVEGEPITHKLREVWPGGGNIPLKEWVDAVKATGYDGWWSPELHSPKHWELDPWDVAYNLRELLRFMLI